MKKIKERKPFKREYIPVIIAGVILLALLIALVWVILWQFKGKKYEIETNPADVQEVLIDSANYATNKEEYEKLAEEAKKIKINYEMKDDHLAGYDYPEDWGEGEGEVILDEVPHTEEFAIYERYFEITFSGVDAKNMYLVLNDTVGMLKNHISHADEEDGILVLQVLYTARVNEYTIEVRESKGSDEGILLRKMKFKTPRYNVYYETAFCSMFPENKYCPETTFENFSSVQFEKESIRLLKDNKDSYYAKAKESVEKKIGKKLEEEPKEEKKTFIDNVIDWAKKNTVMAIIIGVVIVLGVAATIIFTKKTKKRSSVQ